MEMKFANITVPLRECRIGTVLYHIRTATYGHLASFAYNDSGELIINACWGRSTSIKTLTHEPIHPSQVEIFL